MDRDTVEEGLNHSQGWCAEDGGGATDLAVDAEGSAVAQRNDTAGDLREGDLRAECIGGQVAHDHLRR
jgi:hypothetical protein